jgi:hypothetical protein
VLAFSCLVTTQCSISSASGGGILLRASTRTGGGGGGGGTDAVGLRVSAQPARNTSERTSQSRLMAMNQMIDQATIAPPAWSDL